MDSEMAGFRSDRRSVYFAKLNPHQMTAILAASHAKIKEKKHILALHNAEKYATQALCHQMESESCQMEDVVHGLEENARELSLQQGFINEQNRLR